MRIYLVDFENVKSKGLEDIDKLEETDNVIIFYSENSDTISFEMHQRVLSSKAEVEYFKVNVGGKNALDFQLSTLLGYLVAKAQYSHIFVISNDRGFEFLHDFWNGNYVDAPETIVYRSKTIAAAIKYAQSSSLEITQEETESAAIDSEKEEMTETAEPNIEENVEEEVVAEITSPMVENSTKAEPTQVKQPRQKAIRLRANMSFDEMLSALLKEKFDENDISTIRQLIIESANKEEFHNMLAKNYKQQGTEFYKAVKTNYLKIKNKYNEENPTEDNLTKEEVSEKIEEEPVTEIPENVESTDDFSPVPDRLTELLCGICGEDDIARVRSCVLGAKTKQQLYIRMIKEFRKEKGCEYYNAIRSEYSQLSKQLQEI